MTESEKSFVARREAFIAQARTLLAADSRLVAGWLAGSLAAGTADTYSDVDLYLGIADDDLNTVWDERLDLIGQVAPILASADFTFADGSRAVGCLVDGPIKVDVVFLAERNLASPPRRSVVPLWGSVPSTPIEQADQLPADAEVRRALDGLIRMTLQGGLWPIRVLGRGQWGTFVYIELLLIETAIVPLLLLQTDPQALHRNQFSRTQRLTSGQRRHVEDLTNAVITAAATHEYAALLPPHLAIYREICRLGREACTHYGLAFPPQIEDAMTAFYEREWPHSPSLTDTNT